LSFDLDCSREHAFRVWTADIGRWWPRDHTVSGERTADVLLDGRVGGLIVERTSGGVSHEWGEILVWEPPQRLAYLWYLRRDRSDATEVEIVFAERAGGTTVEITHRGWEQLGARGPDFREGNRRGWSGVLPHFIAAASVEKETP
jgi:uncharacterized protein YndB with AHSA1/START domain